MLTLLVSYLKFNMRLFKFQILILLFVVIENVFTIESEIWVKVNLNKMYLERDPLTEKFNTISKFFCGMSCFRNPTCNIWSYDKFGICTLSTTYVSPKYVEHSPNFVRCYTRKRQDLAIGSFTTSTQAMPGGVTSDQIIKGVFLEGIGIPFQSDSDVDPWVLFDLVKTAEITEVLVSSKWSTIICAEVKVKIGNTWISDGDFTTYDQLDNVKDKCQVMNDIMHFKPSVPVRCQFIAVIRKTSPNMIARISINYIEIDGEHISP